MSSRGGPSPAAYHIRSLVGYNNHQENSLKPRMPQWSIGHKLEDKHYTAGPGPAQYAPAKNVSKFDPPKFSLGKRVEYNRKFFYFDDLFFKIIFLFILPASKKSPGPANYDIPDLNKVKFRPYTYVIGERLAALRSRTSGPPPNAYMYNINITKPEAPKFQMLERISDKLNSRSPGPAYYDKSGQSKNKTLREPPSFSMVSSNAIVHSSRTPAPNYYNTSNYDPMDRAPTYVMGQRYNAYSHTLTVPDDNCVD